MSSLYDTGIRPAIDAYLKEKSEQERDYGEYWSASSAGYCMRLNIMRRLGVPKVPELADNATQTRIFEAGHIFHEWLQRITKNAGLSIASEVELQDEDLMIRGHFDDLVLIENIVEVSEDDGEGHTDVVEAMDRHLILYDYKTAHSASFNYKKDQPMGYYHKMQLGTYMYMLRGNGKFEYNPPTLKGGVLTHDGTVVSTTPLEEARILSISKDDLRLDEKQLLWTPELSDEVLRYWQTLNKYWAEKKLPPCTCLDHDGGFMGKRSSKGKIYNDYFYEDEPCSLKWYKKWKETK